MFRDEIPKFSLNNLRILDNLRRYSQLFSNNKRIVTKECIFRHISTVADLDVVCKQKIVISDVSQEKTRNVCKITKEKSKFGMFRIILKTKNGKAADTSPNPLG